MAAICHKITAVVALAKFYNDWINVNQTKFCEILFTRADLEGGGGVPP